MSQDIQKAKERFYKKTKWNGECLESTYSPNSHKYPLIKINGMPKGTHRISWIFNNGEIPKGMYVLHKCDNPRCIRIDHLFLGTAQDNTTDMFNKNRHDFWGMQKYPDEIAEKAIKLKLEGKYYKEIAEELGINQHTVHTFFRRKTMIEKVKSFYAIPKYPKEVIDKAFQLRDLGVQCKEIQRILNIPKRSLSRILNPKDLAINAVQ